MAVDLCVGRGDSCVSACELLCEYRDSLKMPTALTHLFEELCVEHCDKEVKQRLLQRAGLQCRQFNQTHAQLEVENQVRKLRDLQSEKDMQLSNTLLASGLANKVEGRDYRLETLEGCSAKLGGHRVLWIKI